MRTLSLVIAASVFIVATPATAAPLCSVGDQAQVLWKGKWYPAKVTKVNEDQSNCFIRYDGYGAEWDEWVSTGRFKKVGAVEPSGYKVGDSVSCNWKGGATLYPGVIAEKTGNNVFIHYNDGDKEHTTVDKCQPRSGGGSSGAMQKGSAVSCNWKGRGTWYPGIIAEKTGNAVFIHFNDGDKEHTKLSMCRPR
jgi:hypothetical protein